MDNCPVCTTGKLLTKLSSAGEETFCVGCRRIIASASLGFKFASDNVEECKGPEGDPRPGFKGPGKKAKCWLYDSGDKDQEEKARNKARESAYAFQHKQRKGMIVNATGYFSGTPSSMAAPATGQEVSPAKPLDFGARANPTPPAVQSAAGATPATGGMMNSGNVPAAPGGIQPGNLNGPNPLNSGTTASRKILALAEELIVEHDPHDIRTYMGEAFCTKHNRIDECKLD